MTRSAGSLYGCVVALLFLGIGVCAQTPPTSWAARTSNTTQTLNGVAYGNGVFVAVGYSGTVLTSPDGVMWTAKNSGVSNILYGITYSAKWQAFVAVGDRVIIVSNDNGNSWTAQTVSPLLRGVAAGYQLVAAGGQDILITNYPWGGWKDQQQTPGSNLLAVACTDESVTSNAMCAAVGVNGQVLMATIPAPSSNTLPQWTAVACNFGGDFDAITNVWLQNFVAIGEQFTSTGTVQKLAFLTGTTCSTKDAPDLNMMYGMTFGNGFGAAVGYGATMYTTPQFNWMNWADVLLPTAQWAWLNGVTYGSGNGTFVAVGWDGAIYQAQSQPPPTRLLQISPTNVNFGNDGDGFVCVRPVTASNTGNSVVTVQSVSSTDPVFRAAGPFPLSIQPGAQTNLLLDYVPTAVTVDTGSMTIASDATNAVPSIQVSGTGVQAPSPTTIVNALANALSFDRSGAKPQPDWTGFAALFKPTAVIVIPQLSRRSLTVAGLITMLKKEFQSQISNKVTVTRASGRSWCDGDPTISASATANMLAVSQRRQQVSGQFEIHIDTSGLINKLVVDRIATSFPR